MSMRPADRAQREAALDTQRSFLVEAPAGSGKTGLLIQRYLKLLLDDEVTDPTQVLAITFTKKATEEIRSRVLKALASAADDLSSPDEFRRITAEIASAVLQRDAALNWGLLDQPARLKIRTIDALAAEIASTLPILSGSFGALNPAEDAMPLLRRAARRTLQRLGGEDKVLDASIRAALLRRDVNLGDVEGLLAGMLARRDQWMSLLPKEDADWSDAALDAKVLPQMEHVLQQEVCSRLSAAVKAFPAAMQTQVQRLLGELCECDGYNGAPNPLSSHFRDSPCLPGDSPEEVAAWMALTELLTTKDGWRRSFNRNFIRLDLGKGKLKEQFIEFHTAVQSDALLAALDAIRTAPPHVYPADQWVATKALLRVLRQAMSDLKSVFAEEAQCDFTEVTIAAQRALATEDGPTEYAAAIGVHLRHLVMDEVQDTSTAQYELLKALTYGWDGYGQTVFLVGDPKQSIYLFREARVELFLSAMREQRLGELPLTVLHLTANFRSQKNLIDIFNDTFAHVFADSAVTYTEVDAEVPETDHSLHWRTAMLPAKTKDGDKRIAFKKKAWEAEAIVARVREWISDNPARPYDIAVLVRARPHAATIVRALRAAKIPVRAVDLELLAERPEILDLLALTRALLHPADRTAWLAVLHAPWCGLGLADLHAIAGGDRTETRRRPLLQVARENLAQVSAEMRPRAAAVLHTLASALEQKGRLPLAQWIEAAWRTLGADTYLDPASHSNAMRFFSMLQAMDAEPGAVSMERIASGLNGLYAKSGAEAGVEVMTIHKAKGLEWDLVLLPGVELKSRPDDVPLLAWSAIPSGEKELPIFAPIPQRGDEASGLNRFLSMRKSELSLAEVKRLFYVAATRARKELQIFASVTPTKDGAIAPTRGTLLHAAWAAAEEHFTEPEMRFVSADESGLTVAAAATTEKVAYVERAEVRMLPSPAIDLQAGAEPDTAPRFARPEGSFAARSVGDTVHVFLEELARQANTQSLDEIAKELPTWTKRAERYAVSRGLALRAAEEAAVTTVRALQNVIHGEIGQWLFAKHPEAQSEWKVGRYRIDRTFLAGEQALSQGVSHRWIVDFKTSERGSDLNDFLAHEREVYAPQLDTYAVAMEETRPVMLALYYPRMDCLIYWEHPGGVSRILHPAKI